jgi:hypothetical protein
MYAIAMKAIAKNIPYVTTILFIVWFLPFVKSMCSSNASAFSVAQHARWIVSLNIMARNTAFDISPRQLRMPAAAGSFSKRREPCDGMRRRFEFLLGDITACLVAIGAECLGVMTGAAIGGLRSCINAVSKPVL